jgi:hypothetical protein
MFNGKYSDRWAVTLFHLAEFLQSTPATETAKDDLALEYGEGSYLDPFETNLGGYHGSYSRLVYAGRPVRYPFNGSTSPAAAVGDVRVHLAGALNAIRGVDPGKLSSLVGALPDLAAQQAVAGLMQALNVPL